MQTWVRSERACPSRRYGESQEPGGYKVLRTSSFSRHRGQSKLSCRAGKLILGYCVDIIVTRGSYVVAINCIELPLPWLQKTRFDRFEVGFSFRWTVIPPMGCSASSDCVMIILLTFRAGSAPGYFCLRPVQPRTQHDLSARPGLSCSVRLGSSRELQKTPQFRLLPQAPDYR
jgi:hypothetical protein